MEAVWLKYGTEARRVVVARLTETVRCVKQRWQGLRRRLYVATVSQRRIWGLQIPPHQVRGNESFFYGALSTSDLQLALSAAQQQPSSGWIDVDVQDDELAIEYLEGQRQLPVLSFTLVEKDGSV